MATLTVSRRKRANMDADELKIPVAIALCKSSAKPRNMSSGDYVSQLRDKLLTETRNALQSQVVSDELWAITSNHLDAARRLDPKYYASIQKNIDICDADMKLLIDLLYGTPEKHCKEDILLRYAQIVGDFFNQLDELKLTISAVKYGLSKIDELIVEAFSADKVSQRALGCISLLSKSKIASRHVSIKAVELLENFLDLMKNYCAHLPFVFTHLTEIMNSYYIFELIEKSYAAYKLQESRSSEKNETDTIEYSLSGSQADCVDKAVSEVMSRVNQECSELYPLLAYRAMEIMNIK